MAPLLLLVDDDAAVCWALEQSLTAAGYRCRTAADGRAARRHLTRERPDLVITDVRMPGESGLDLLRWLREHHPGLPVIVSTAYGTLESAATAVERGAVEYVPKPVDPARLLVAVARALGDAALAAAAPPAAPVPDLLGQGPAMQEVFRRLGAAAMSDSTVLLTGPSGAGKSLAARRLQALGRRRDQPLTVVAACDIGDDPTEALSSGGTVVLDDLPDLRPQAQARLLSLLDRPLPCRVIALSSLGVEALRQSGPLRPDLVHRLAVVTIALPPLAERLEDLPLLARHLLAEAAERCGRRLSITDAALAVAAGHDWPGNVRELKHRLEAAAVLAPGGIIDAEHLDLGHRSGLRPTLASVLEPRIRAALASRPGHVHAEIWNEVEALLVHTALAVTEGNQLRAAELLGINRITLKKRMDQASNTGKS